jgi:hypothetical protein
MDSAEDRWLIAMFMTDDKASKCQVTLREELLQPFET